VRPEIVIAVAAALGACALSACSAIQGEGGGGSGSQTPPAVTAITATVATTATVAAAPGTPGTAEAAAPVVTPDQTQIAVAQAFEFPSLGDQDALVVVYEFSDYRCPYCRQFWELTFPEMREEYLVPGGNVSLDYVDFPIEDHGIPAVVSAEGAHCAGEQDSYWEMHEALFGSFAKMNDLSLEDEAASIDFVVDLGDDLGIDTAALRDCLETKRYRPTVATVYRDARDADVGVTPTFLVGVNHVYTNEEGKLVFPPGSEPRDPPTSEVLLGFMPWEEFRPVVERQLALALGTPWPTPTPRPTLSPTPTREVSPTPTTTD
jgi:protein-disulfide isomerase